jgi:hypothetical protein
MANKFFSTQLTPNTVSADRDPDNRSFLGTVIQSGKPVVDYEFQLSWDIQNTLKELVRRQQLPSGFLKGQARKRTYQDFSFTAPTDISFVADTFHMSRQTAIVAGMPVVIEYTNTSVDGDNLIQLDTPPVLGGAPPDIKRTDFVFLEVWLSLVGPSPRAQATVTVAPALPADGDILDINGNALTARVLPPGVDEFLVGGDEFVTAANIMAAVNNPANSFFVDVAAATPGNAVVTFTAQDPGAVGNALTLVSSAPAVLVISGPVFTGGADRLNKPSQSSLYCHGNTLASSAVNLQDDLADPVIITETAQRIQIQYRIRVTGQAEAINFQIQPDGFSNPNVLAQGGMAAPVAGYFFVPADKTTVLGSSDATTYPVEDAGLWIAGDGSSTAATTLQTLDGHVYAIPIAMVFRRNDAYLGGAGAGFDPATNTSGALPVVHALFANPAIGAIQADTSDRPDNAFSNAINANDLLDLRKHVTAVGHDFSSELTWQMQSLLDGDYQTWAISTSDKQTLGSGSGDVSTRHLVANEVGRASGLGGNNVTSGDTTRGVTVRSFDHIARRFGSQAVVERVVFEVLPQDRFVGPAPAPGRVNPGKYVVRAAAAATDVGWFAGDVIHVDLTAMNVSTDGTFDPATASLAAAISNVLQFAPSGTVITDVLSVYHDDGNYDLAVNQQLQPTTIFGLGTGHVDITLDENPVLVSGGMPIEAYATGWINLLANPALGNTVVIDGITLTGVVGPHGFNEYTVNPVVITTNANLRHSINTYVASVTATAPLVPGGISLLTANVIGAGGNLIGLATNNPGVITFSGLTLENGVTGVAENPMVGTVALGDVGSPRRVFVELEVSYPMGSGLTDTPDYPLVPDSANYPVGPLVENDVSQRPADMESPLAPQFREGFRETTLEYVASENGAGAPIGSITPEQFVSRSNTEIVFLRRVFGSAVATINVTDAATAVPVAVDLANTEFGSSSRKVVLGGALSGAQTLASVTYFAQDAIPNYGPAGGGYQNTIYYRSNAPQTVGVKAGAMTGAGGPLPQSLVVEPLLMSPNLWTGQVGVGSQELAYPFAQPLAAIPVNDDSTGTFLGEWSFCATSDIGIDNFNVDTGLLSLPALVPPAETVSFTFGSAIHLPTKDIEFRAFYGYADNTAYRPTIISQFLLGEVRHKVFTPFLARATVDCRLFRKNEVLLLVLSRWAQLDKDNSVRFMDTDNRTCVGVYRTRGLLILAGA